MTCTGIHTQAADATAHASPNVSHGHVVPTFFSSNTCAMNASLPLRFAPIALFGDLIDDQCMRSVANIVLAGDRYMLARKRHQLRVLRRGGRFTIDGEEDGAIVAKDDERRAVFCACLGTRYADGFVETFGVGTCRVNHPA